MRERHGKRELHFHPAGIFFEWLRFRQIKAPDMLIKCAAVPIFIDAALHFVHLPGVQPVREAALVEYYADVLADGDVVAVCVLPENADLSAVAPKLPENERDRRGLARAVFADKPERRAHRHGQRQVLQRKAAEGFGQILNFQCVHGISFQYFRL